MHQSNKEGKAAGIGGGVLVSTLLSIVYFFTHTSHFVFYTCILHFFSSEHPGIKEMTIQWPDGHWNEIEEMIENFVVSYFPK